MMKKRRRYLGRTVAVVSDKVEGFELAETLQKFLDLFLVEVSG